MTGFDIFVTYVFVYAFGLICGADKSSDACGAFGLGMVICCICLIIGVTRLLTFANA